jgi:small subunit ribosomal protein S17
VEENKMTKKTSKKTVKKAKKAPAKKEKAEAKCQDPNCPVHGKIKVRGSTLKGKVVSDKMDKSIIVEISHLKKNPKYERYMRTKTRIAAHLPPCMQAKTGDVVEIGETRKISKTKSFVVTKKVEK